TRLAPSSRASSPACSTLPFPNTNRVRGWLSKAARELDAGAVMQPAGAREGGIRISCAFNGAAFPQELEHVPFVGLVPGHLSGGHRADIQPFDVRELQQLGDE